MPANKILQKVDFGKAMVVAGKLVKLSGATQTQDWSRPTLAVQAIEPEFTKAAEKFTEPLPEGTVEIAIRDGEHSNNKDPREHFSVVCFDANGNPVGTLHFPKD